MTKFNVFRPVFTQTTEKLPDGRHYFDVTMAYQGSFYADSEQAAMSAAKQEGIRAPIVAPAR